MSLLKNIKEVDFIIRQLQKVESKLRSGQIIDAWREITRIIAYLHKIKEDLIKNEIKDCSNQNSNIKEIEEDN